MIERRILRLIFTMNPIQHFKCWKMSLKTDDHVTWFLLFYCFARMQTVVNDISHNLTCHSSYFIGYGWRWFAFIDSNDFYNAILSAQAPETQTFWEIYSDRHDKNTKQHIKFYLVNNTRFKLRTRTPNSKDSYSISLIWAA